MRPGLLASLDPAFVKRHFETVPAMSAREIMSAPPVILRDETPLSRAAETMLERELKRLPVVDASGALVGMLSRYDIFRALARFAPATRQDAEAKPVPPPKGRCVGEVMNRDMRQVRPETPVDAVIRTLVGEGVQRVAVTDAGGRFLGLVSDRILLDALADHKAGIWELVTSRFSFAKRREHHKILKDIRGRTAGEVMVRDLVTVREETPIDEAIRLMTQRSLKRLPVVDEAGRFRGMVGRDHLLRAKLAAESTGPPETTER